MANATHLDSNPPIQPFLTRLVPLDEPAVEEGFMVHIGGSSFYVRHLRDGAVLGHTQEEWETLLGTEIQGFIDTLQAEHPTFDTAQVSEMTIQLSGRVTYKTLSDPVRSIELRTSGAALNALAARVTNLSITFDAITVEGSFDQARSQLVLENEDAKHACTMIDSVFAEFALLHENSDFLNPVVIDGSIIQGQKRFMAIRPAIEARLAEISADAQAHGEADPLQGEQAFINFDGVERSCPLLQKGNMQTKNLTQNTDTDFAGILRELSSSSQASAVFGGITSRGESFGVVLYKNEEQEVQEVVYFDSHSRPANGTPHACAKIFKTIAEAARFLAHRNPFEQGAAAQRNQLTITPLHLSPGLQNFRNAQKRYNTSEDAERDPDALVECYEVLNQQKPSVGQAILHLTGNQKNAAALARVTSRTIFHAFMI